MFTLQLDYVNYFCVSLRFNGHIPGEPGLAGVYWSKGWWRWWWQLDYWSYKLCKALVRSSPPTNRHPVFFTGRMPFLSPNQQCQSTEGKISDSMDLLTPSSPGGLSLYLWPLITPGYLGGGLPCLSSALWCQYPNVSYFCVFFCICLQKPNTTIRIFDRSVSLAFNEYASHIKKI